MKKKIQFVLLTLTLIVSLWQCSDPTKNNDNMAGFLQTEDKMIVDGSGNEVLLRGMGFGGWMVQEPYMMLVSGSATEGQHSIFADIEELIGTERLETYHQAWLDNYCTEEDVEKLSILGFNSLRVAMHYNLFTLPIQEEPVQGENTWRDRGFEMIDKLLEWCAANQVYLILDLHAAPGGQGQDANISDYDPSKPSLWESDQNKQKTIDLWRKLAERYSDEPWIGGYDLINEPNWYLGEENIELKQLYEKLIAAIREVDQNHIIFIEGNWFANDHTGLWPFDDDNIVLSFHRYWCDNTTETILHYLQMRDKYNVPLWMGESGENNNQWYEEAVQLLEEYKIGWAWWTWKKMESTTGAYTIPKPQGYDELINYWQNGGEKPDTSFAYDVMMQVAENAKIDRCSLNGEVVQALIQE
ncbi:MAG: glycoside hydrolase family 5 protein [Candidatus Marinimicrobia bacterium]|nr:glycoside hydrolase family 5 protein [Candidatus Neomarinimicrobiota bacterium]